MKFWHFYIIKSPLLLIGYVLGTHDVAFLYAAIGSLAAIPLFAYLEQ